MGQKLCVKGCASRVIGIALFLILCFFVNGYPLAAENSLADPVILNDLPSLSKDAPLFKSERVFGYRNKIGGFMFPPCRVGAYYDKKVYYQGEDVDGFVQAPVEKLDRQSMKTIYHKNDMKSFCGSYIIMMADMSEYKTMTFLIKGEKGGESFELGMNDIISNKREDSVYVGSINRYIPNGIKTDWQLVKIPLSDFYGPDISKVYSIIFHINDISMGTFWIDEIRFFKEDLVASERQEAIERHGYLLMDDFNYTDINLLGGKTNSYKKLPSVCVFRRDPKEHFGPKGRALRIDFKKEAIGWAGYYTLLNQIDGAYFDLSMYESVSFMVKGASGGETFEIGMADKNWSIIGDSLKAGMVDKFLPGGITTKWQEAIIPLEDFGLLDFSEIGSFAINFSEKSEGTVYIDDLKFYLKKEEKNANDTQ